MAIFERTKEHDNKPFPGQAKRPPLRRAVGLSVRYADLSPRFVLLAVQNAVEGEGVSYHLSELALLPVYRREVRFNRGCGFNETTAGDEKYRINVTLSHRNCGVCIS